MSSDIKKEKKRITRRSFPLGPSKGGLNSE